MTAAVLAGESAFPDPAFAQETGSVIILLSDPAGTLLNLPPVRRATDALRDALTARGCMVRLTDQSDLANDADEIIIMALATSPTARGLLAVGRLAIPDAPESLGLVRGRLKDRAVLLACGADGRGLAYALLELADRVTYGEQPLAVLREVQGLVEQPANEIRSVTRTFLGGVQDKGWFHDSEFWRDYLAMLISQRFNRFSLAFGMAYDAPRQVGDSYFHFAYPFLFSVPGYEVVARGLPDEERDRNLAMLRWISGEAKALGLHFQLGVWNHGYQFPDSPDLDYPITGLTPENHAPYCRDALEKLLAACPAIDGITFRCHSEAGVSGDGLSFWPTVFDGLKRSGRRVEIDIHSKGIEPSFLEMALKTGLPVNVSPKYGAEHMGLPYHQTAIQEGERFKPVPGEAHTTEQQRSFTRYGYADYLREDRDYGVFFRIWPGTQRLLLWGDPVLAAGYGRLAGFCGAKGVELFEPLSLKGRRGAVSAGNRETYADATLRPAKGDWEKYRDTYRIWGRLLFNPEADTDSWSRQWVAEFGPAASDCGDALGNASRILPLVTMAHMPSVSIGGYWPEIHTNVPIVTGRFATVQALDPGLFSSIDEFAGELVNAERSGKIPPTGVAQWLEQLADAADQSLARARSRMVDPVDPAFRRLQIDVEVQSGTGRYLARKLRAGLAFVLYVRLGDRAALEQAIHHYGLARDAWMRIVEVTRGVYRENLVFDIESRPFLYGHWADRLPAIEEDLAKMVAMLGEKPSAATLPARKDAPSASELFTAALAATAAPPNHPEWEHVPPPAFRPGDPVEIEFTAEEGHQLQSARLYYRHVNHGEVIQTLECIAEGNRYRQTIPGEYTDSPFPLIYYFELRDRLGEAWIVPGLAPDLSNQPYFVLRQIS